MIERFSQGKLLWVNLKNPTIEDVHEVMDECSVPPTLMGDITGPVPRSEVTSIDNTIKLTMDFPIVKRTDIDYPHELKFIITKKCLITAHYEEMEGIDRFKKEFEVISTLGKASKKATGAHIFISLINVLYHVAESKLDYIETKLTDIETEIFNENEKQMVYEISSMSKRLISFRQTMRSHDEIFRDSRPLFESNFNHVLDQELQDTYGHYFYIVRRTASLIETLDALRETNMALLTTKQNEIMKTLTIMAFITFPLTLMTSMFGMNTETLPIVGFKGDFWIILAIMVAATIFFFTFFKYKKWI